MDIANVEIFDEIIDACRENAGVVEREGEQQEKRKIRLNQKHLRHIITGIIIRLGNSFNQLIAVVIYRYPQYQLSLFPVFL